MQVAVKSFLQRKLELLGGENAFVQCAGRGNVVAFRMVVITTQTTEYGSGKIYFIFQRE